MGENLMERIMRGEKEAIEKIVMKYSKEVYVFCYYITGSESASTYLAGKIFFELPKRIKSKEENLRNLIYKVAVQICTSHLKRSGRLNSYECSDENEKYYCSENSIRIREMDINEEGKFQIRYAAAALPSDLKITYFLKECCEFNYEEIAEILSLSKEEVRQKIARARRIILKKIESKLLILKNIKGSTKEVDN